MAGKVEMNLKGIEHIRKRIADTSGPVDKMFKAWGEKYLGFVDQRFDKFSKGGGDWPKLKDSTVRRRRKGGKKRGGVSRAVSRLTGGGKVAMLADTGVLKGGLTVGRSGNLFRRTSGGIRVGFGGLASHPGSKLTIRQLAIIHDQGVPEKNIPQRQILVKPDRRLRRRMNADLKKMLKQIAKEGERKL